jgi:hypothetical protein
VTAQAPEKLIYKGTELALCTEPLARFPGLKPLLQPYDYPSSGLWRGYIGTWAIESDRLYLKALKRWKTVRGEFTTVGIEDLFPGYPDGVFAHWFTGELRCPRGALLRYVHGGFFSIYEEDLFIDVMRGVVIDERRVRNRTASHTVDVDFILSAMKPP